jgi:hypothetical protein
LSCKTNLRIFETNVKPVLLYWWQTWKITRNLVNKLQTFVNTCLHAILQIRWPMKVFNRALWDRPNNNQLK